MAAQRDDRLDVGLESRSAGRIEPREAQDNGDVAFVNANRTGF